MTEPDSRDKPESDWRQKIVDLDDTITALPMSTALHEETLDRTLRLLSRARRCLDHLGDESRPFIFRDLDAAMARDLAGEIVQLIGHSITDQPEAEEMFALREFVGEACEKLDGAK